MATVRPPLVRADLNLRVAQLAPRIGSWPEPALLESGPGFGAAGRWSILTARPRLVFEATGTEWRTRTESGTAESGAGDVLAPLARLLQVYGLADSLESPDPDLPPFQGGMIGFFGYDLAPRLERLPRRAGRDSRLPDVRFALYDTAVTVDHATGAVEFWAFDLLGEGEAAASRRCRDWRRALARPACARPLLAPRPAVEPLFARTNTWTP